MFAETRVYADGRNGAIRPIDGNYPTFSYDCANCKRQVRGIWEKRLTCQHCGARVENRAEGRRFQ